MIHDECLIGLAVLASAERLSCGWHGRARLADRRDEARAGAEVLPGLSRGKRIVGINLPPEKYRLSAKVSLQANRGMNRVLNKFTGVAECGSRCCLYVVENR